MNYHTEIERSRLELQQTKLPSDARKAGYLELQRLIEKYLQAEGVK